MSMLVHLTARRRTMMRSWWCPGSGVLEFRGQGRQPVVTAKAGGNVRVGVPGVARPRRGGPVIPVAADSVTFLHVRLKGCRTF
jgi:hypothetical protein